MNRIARHLTLFPEILLLLAAAILPLLLLNTTMDIHLHDTYFVIAGWMASIPFCSMLVMAFVLHSILVKRNRRSKTVAWSHSLSSLVCLIMLAIVMVNVNRGSAGTNWDDFDRFNSLYKLSSVIIITFFIIQGVFVIYFIVRMMRSGRNKLQSR
jgi:cytochrome c oxidase subunit I